MATFLETTTERLQAALPDAVQEVIDFRGERTILVTQKSLLKVLKFLRDDEALQYNMLADIVADDYLDEFPRFYVSYMLYSIPNKTRVRIRIGVEDPDDGPESLQDLWKIGSWLELEVYDLMGITFKNHGALRRLFLPEDWQGHPLRKDYPLGYEEVQFSFNYEQIDARKPYAKD